MKRVNYHTHTSYCRHAKGTVADYAKEADKKGLEILGFSDHLPFPGNPYGYRMDYEDLSFYREDILAEQETYKDRMKIIYGFEGEYVRGQEPYYEELYQKELCQYMLLGQHWFTDKDGRFWQTGELPSTQSYLEYMRAILEGMKTGFFQIIAHPDLVFMNHYAWDEECERACDLLLEGCTKGDYILEYNANGYRRGIGDFDDGKRYQYPHAGLWEKVAKTNISVIIGSDCHNPVQMYDGFVEKAYEDAAKMGLKVITDFRRRDGGSAKQEEKL